MIKIKIICIGKLHYKELYETSRRFEKMISGFSRLEILELPESKRPYPRNLEDEKELILKHLRDEFFILLDREGEFLSSEEFAKIIKNNIDSGKSISFLIGGHQGVSKDLKNKADFVLSFSKMTFGHNIFRIMLLEQIYRALSIIFNTKYHK
ncbi:MAG: 23S rRNA (pseudouridine(1915)-N(3))-methyltransferase RlmH [Brevinematia bacterium]